MPARARRSHIARLCSATASTATRRDVRARSAMRPTISAVAHRARLCSPPVAEPLIVVTRPVPEHAPAMLRPRARVAVGPNEPPLPTADAGVQQIRDADLGYTLPQNPLEAHRTQG